jgi:hypothetical protein
MSSNINPNNIDGVYPVAGQDNNSQGFRDNFTNIKQNFTFAEEEINDLQAKVVLKAALVGESLNNNMAGALLEAAKIQDFSATAVTVQPSGSPLTATLLYSAGHYQSFSLTASTRLAFDQWPNTGSYGLLKLQVNVTNTSYTLTLPASVSQGLSGIQGISPGTPGVENSITFGATGVYEFSFSTINAGSTITLFDLNRALTNFVSADIQTDDITATGFVSAAGNVIGGNIITSGFASATGNVSGGNLRTSGSVSATGNLIAGNINTAGTVSTTGDVQAVNVNGYIRPTAGGATTTSVPLRFTSGATVTSTLPGGSLEYDGVSIYASHQQDQRGVMSVCQFRRLDADVSATNSATAQDIFPTNGTISLPASSAYLIDALYIVGPTGATNINAVTMSTLFDTDGVGLDSIYYTADTAVGLATAVNAVSRKLVTAPTAAVVTGTASAGTVSFFTVHLKGVLRTALATNLAPQMAFSGTPAASGLRVLTGSYFSLTPIAGSSADYVGPWS